MERMTLRELAVPLIKSIDSFNYLLKSHHRRTAVIAYHLGCQLQLNQEQMVNLVVAAALHDIGALSIQERDTLVQEDVDNPFPHCRMGYKMLSTFDVFGEIAQIIKHHHIRFDEAPTYDDQILFQSYIIHLADRVDIYISPDTFILNQKKKVSEAILQRRGTIFHPEVCDAFAEVATADIFWIEVNNMSIEELFRKIHFGSFNELSREQTRQFALMISRIIDFRSEFTAAHSYSVAQLASSIGSLLGLSEDICFKLMIAGLFHDIGKIGIDTGYLEKDGPLTEEEYNQVKLHSYYTGQILKELSSSDWFCDVVDWAQNHHEKLDGSGYPYALLGDFISTGTRIIAYADILTALMEDRPYRKGLSVDVSLDIVKKEFAEKIDSKIFSVLSMHREEIDAIVKRCRLEALQVYAKNSQENGSTKGASAAPVPQSGGNHSTAPAAPA